MAKALLLALLLPLAQEDPQVTYREGLFEEVDQGNLEKAAELYAKVLKSSAPDALKAKALLRTGFCHEKKGKKKEAEQAWRDVVERYPSAAEIVKQARERLSRPEELAPVSIDVQIQDSILDLGATNPDQRSLAIRKLVLMGEAAVPELTRALQHRDRHLSLGAARALIELERWDGVYEVFRRHYPSIPNEDTNGLAQLLKKREQDRAKFLKDAKLFIDGSLVGYMTNALMSLKSPEMDRFVEDWLASAKLVHTWDGAFSGWKEYVGDVERARLIETLSESDRPKFAKLNRVLVHLAQTEAGPETQNAVLKALAQNPNPVELIEEPGGKEKYDIVPYLKICDTEALFRGPVAAWLAKEDNAFRRRILLVLLYRCDHFRDPVKARDQLFDLLASPKIPLAVREVGIKSAPWGKDFQPFMDRFMRLCLEVVRAGTPTEDANALRTLCTYLPPDSKDLPGVLDAVFDKLHPITAERASPIEAARQKAIQGPLMDAAIRAIQRQSAGSRWSLELIQLHGTPEQRLLLGSMVPGWKDSWSADTLAYVYTMGLTAAPKDSEEAAWREFRKIFDESPDRMKVSLANRLPEHTHPLTAEFMKSAMDSNVEDVREASIHYWRYAATADSIPLLIRALNDKAAENRYHAISALGELRALDAVPELIRFLEGTDPKLRDAASEALKAIRQHYEDRLQWKRWYDETKKALGK